MLRADALAYGRDVLCADADEQKGKKEKKKKKKTYFSVDVLCADALACVLRADADEQKGKKKEKKEKEQEKNLLQCGRVACGRVGVCCVWMWMSRKEKEKRKNLL